MDRWDISTTVSVAISQTSRVHTAANCMEILCKSVMQTRTKTNPFKFNTIQNAKNTTCQIYISLPTSTSTNLMLAFEQIKQLAIHDAIPVHSGMNHALNSAPWYLGMLFKPLQIPYIYVYIDIDNQTYI